MIFFSFALNEGLAKGLAEEGDFKSMGSDSIDYSVYA